MQPAPLTVARENLADRLDDLLAYLATVRRMEVEAATVDKICAHYRQLAIACLLHDADTDGLFRNAAASGLAYAHMLSRVQWPAVVDFQYLCASRALPFFDAVVAGDYQTAERIKVGSRAEWSRDDEDESDFLRMRFLMGLIGPEQAGGNPPARLLAQLLERSDPDDPRIAVCVALQKGDGPAFEGAMTRFTEELHEAWTEERKNPNRDPEQVLTEGAVSMEAAALVRLARRAGISDRTEYLLVPAMVLADPPAQPYPADLWLRGA